MTQLQNLQVWIGLGFAIFLVVFFMVVFFVRPKLTDDQRTTLRMLFSLCAGFSGAMIAGDAIVRMNLPVGGAGNLAVRGTAGFALFFVVWFTHSQIFPPGFYFSVPAGWTFRALTDQIAQQDKSTIEYLQFTRDELDTPLLPRELHCESPTEAIKAVRHICQVPVRNYSVRHTAGHYTLEIQ